MLAPPAHSSGQSSRRNKAHSTTLLIQTRPTPITRPLAIAPATAVLRVLMHGLLRPSAEPPAVSEFDPISRRRRGAATAVFPAAAAWILVALAIAWARPAGASCDAGTGLPPGGVRVLLVHSQVLLCPHRLRASAPVAPSGAGHSALLLVCLESV